MVIGMSAGDRRRVHPRVMRVLHHIQLHGPDRTETSLVRLAQVAELSPSRLMHVFTTSLGLPLRRYLLRLKVRRAVTALARGHSVTEAAYIGGFADAPHLTRTVRRTLGVTPRELMKRTADL